jgi:transcription termination/antitermination protein NusG
VSDHPHNSSPHAGDASSLELPHTAPAGSIAGEPAAAQPLPPDDVAPQAAVEESQPLSGELPADEGHHEAQAHGSADEVASGHVESTIEASESASEDSGEVAEEVVEEEEEERGPIEETPIVDEPPKMDWFILKVQSNREESIRESLKRRVAVAGLDRYFGEIIVPTEMVSEFKGGKKRVVKRKLYPGYLVVNMEINEDTWFLVRETPGIGDFTGSAGKPTPMLPHEVSKIVAKQEEKTDEAPKLKINFNVSDRVKINEGTFENFEGEVDSIDEASGRVTVMINIFGRSTPVELEYWQIETI